jgi:hypothetical protein
MIIFQGMYMGITIRTMLISNVSKDNFYFHRLIDLDSANIRPQSSSNNLEMPCLPEPDIKVLKNHLKQVRNRFDESIRHLIVN